MKFQRTAPNWIQGVSGKYTVTAKVFPEPSADGITGDVTEGHISKLEIQEGGNIVFNYDRGLDFNFMDPAPLAQILQAAEKFAKQNL